MNRVKSCAGRRVWALLVVVVLLGGQTAHVFAVGQGTQRFASEPVYFDYPAGWGVTRDASNPALPGYVLARAGLNAQITLYVAPREIDAAEGQVPTLLAAARSSLLLPLIEQFIQPLEAMGAQVQRAQTSAEIGGVRVSGDRWLVSAAGDSLSVDAYLLALNKHLVIVVFNQPTNATAQSAPAWELFRRTLSIGTPPPAAPVATPQPKAMPSSAALQEATALLTEMNELTGKSLALRKEGNYAAAIVPAERAVTVAEKVEAVEMPAEYKLPVLPGALNLLAALYRLTGDYARAAPLLKRALALNEQAKGANDPALASPLNEIGALYYETGDYAQALTHFQRAYELLQKSKGPDDPATATALNNLALVYDAQNDFAQTETLMRRALAIREKALGPDHPDVAVSLSNLGGLYDELGDPGRAEPLFRRALAIREKASGPDHPDVATLLNNLGLLFKHKGDFTQAESYFNRSLAVGEKALGPQHPSLAPTVDNLAQLFFDKGDYTRAETLYKRGLALREQAYGAEHPDVAESLNNLALLYQTRTEYERARPLYERSRAIFERKFGAEHRLVATTLDNIATLDRAENNYDRAEPLMQRALAIRTKLYGADSPDTAVSYNNLGSLAFARGDYARAVALHTRALRAYERAYGSQHPALANFLGNLSTDYYGQGDITHAVETQQRAATITERQIALVLSTGSEEQKRLFMQTLVEDTDYTLFLHAAGAPTSAQVLQLALTIVLQRKGRVLDAMSDQIGVLRRRLGPEDRVLLERLSTVNAELATLVLKGPGQASPDEYQARLAKLNAESNDLQAQISARSTEFRAQSQAVTLAAVQQAIPAGAALVEFALYRPYNVKGKNRQERFGAPRYVAYVLRAGSAPAWIELGPAAELDQAIGAWRAALANPQRADAQQLARALDERVMRPVRRLLGDTRQLFLSPDGALNLIPFGALTDEQNRYLIETYSITYLTSGRDLLRLAAKTQNRQGAVVVADPSFDDGSTATTNPTDNTARRSFDLASARFSRLPGTAEEGRALGVIMPGLKLLTGAQATEAALKQLSSPLVLHVATHGFFLPDQPRAAGAGETRGLALGGSTATQPQPGENPLLRSGLALAGANMRQNTGGEDGILTALEASGLDLWGTRLVVLSACETGLGAVATGEGVYGLRRALVLAGSESQVMSLWQVSDAATRDLMVAYYKRLQAGEGRTEALRQVQLAMIKTGLQGATGSAQRGIGGDAGARTQTEDRSHPFYWASFIQSGEWRAMSASR